MRVSVLGAGVVGTMTAYYLMKRGHAVEVFERHDDVAQEASFANGGIVHASEVMPWSQPGMPRNVLRWLGKEDAPVLLRYGAIPRVGRWGVEFLRNCTAERFRANTLANLRLALLSQRAFKEVRTDVGLDYDLNTKGCLKIYCSAAALDAAARLSESMRSFGMNFTVADRRGCVALEPALRETADGIAGGIHFPGDELGDSYKFTRGVADHCRRSGVAFHTGSDVQGLEASAGAIAAVR
ncbi:MAG: FAD-dependent oxidoreductase, partial [Alphaproteobacteria bacterium]|nr:FAD-dependent oxidoreductase [Alphaproteobacteria bacterium]